MILTFSASSLDKWDACPTQYNFSSVRRLELSFGDRKKLERGKLFHRLLENHYKMVKEGLLSYGDIILTTTSLAQKLYIDGEYPLDLVEECTFQYQEYCNFYANDGWEILAVEQPFTVTLFEDEKDKIILEGKQDLIVKNHGIIYPVDHKTTERKERVSPLANQPFSYVFVDNAFVFIRNEIGFQKSKGISERMTRHVLSYPQELIDEWKGETIIKGLRIIKSIEDGRFDKYYNSCKFCAYKPICESTPDAREHTIEEKYRVRKEFDIYAEE